MFYLWFLHIRNISDFFSQDIFTKKSYFSYFDKWDTFQIILQIYGEFYIKMLSWLYNRRNSHNEIISLIFFEDKDRSYLATQSICKWNFRSNNISKNIIFIYIHHTCLLQRKYHQTSPQIVWVKMILLFFVLWVFEKNLILASQSAHSQ